jgi:hypothetical protein
MQPQKRMECGIGRTPFQDLGRHRVELRIEILKERLHLYRATRKCMSVHEQIRERDGSLTNAVSSCGLEISSGPTCPAGAPFPAAGADDDAFDSDDFAGVDDVGTFSG